jgi:hypothetical protein
MDQDTAPTPDAKPEMKAFRTDLTEAQLERLWSHGQHEDDMLMQRSNFFLVAQSLLLVAYAGFLGSHADSKTAVAAHIISGFGLALTAMWVLISYRQISYIRVLQRRVECLMPEYRDTRIAWLAFKEGKWWRKAKTYPLISYGVPGLAGVMWFVLLLIA